ncbi:MAG TPA: hypothetical protein VF916_00245, partial [Ktedonobacterales bacterium]
MGQLNTTVSGALSDLADAFVAQRVFWPSWLYLDAPWTTTQHLLRLLDDPAAQEQRHLLLLALAWVDDDLVHTQFQAWRVHPPHWQAVEFLALQEYATRAGWELTPDGGRRQLYRSTSYELVPVDEPELAPSAQAVAVSTPHEASCGWCGR